MSESLEDRIQREQLEQRLRATVVTGQSQKVEKAFDDAVYNAIEKSKSGVYKDDAENRKLGRVGQKYGAEKKEKEGKDSDNKPYDEKEESEKTDKEKLDELKDLLKYGEITKIEFDRRRQDLRARATGHARGII